MRENMISKILGFALSLVTVIWLLASPAIGATINVSLVAEKATVTMPDANVIQMWGFRDVADGSHATGDWKVPTISTMAGDSLVIDLSNSIQAPGLVESVSVIIPGQKATEVNALVPEFFTDPQGRRRVNSFTHSAASTGSDTYEWNNLKAGTYLIQSGTHPAVQMQMGLYAILKVDEAVNLAYTGVPYQNEATLLFSEIDAALHAAVADGTYGTAPAMTSTIGYKPDYFLVNGQPHTAATPAIAAGIQGESLLIRFLNAGLKNRVPVVQGSYMSLIAEDGYLQPYASEQYSVVLAPGKTFDAIIASTPGGLLSIYDRTLGLGNADGTNNGMFAQLDVSMLTLTETAVGDGTFTYTAAVSGGPTPYEYRFWLYDPASGWSSVQNYSATATWAWDPTVLPAGTYYIMVYARIQGSAASFELYKFLSHVIQTVTPATDVTLSETVVGDGTFTYTAAASGGTAPYEYKFWLYDPATGWSVEQDYSTSATWTWNQAFPFTYDPGTYYVMVYARSQGSIASVEAYKLLGHIIVAPPATDVTLSETVVGNGTFTYTAAASGGGPGYEYKFLLYDPASGWFVEQNYSTTATWTWDPTSPVTLPPGSYYIMVYARSQGSAVSVETYKFVGHSIE